MPDGKTAVAPSSSAPFNAVFNPFLINMTTIRTDDPRDLLPSEYEDPWPPSDAEIEMMQWLQDQDDLDKTVPSAAERNRNLK
jgi:hypothetical protein